MASAAFFCFPADGHVNPTLPLVEELVRRGERVDYHCTEDFRAIIERAGAHFCPLTGAIERLKTFDPTRGMFALGEWLAEVTLELLPVLRETLERDRPDYILHDTMTPWGRLVASMLGLPAITTYPSFGTLPEKSVLPPTAILLLVHGLSDVPRNLRHLKRRRELLREAARRFGVDELGFANLITNPSRCNIVFTSEEFQYRRADLDGRFHFVGPSLGEPPDPTFPLADLEGRRVIYASLGTVFNRNVGFFRACLEAFDRDDEMVVIGAGKKLDIASLGPLPARCIVRPHVPQLEVLRRSALFLTHGGMNSVSGALFHQVPMLVLPQGADNFLNARRLEELHLGRKIRARDLNPARLRKISDELVGDPSLRSNLRKMSESFHAAGGPARAAEIVLRFRDAS